MKVNNWFFIIVVFILVMPVANLFLKVAASQPIPQNNVPDSLYVSLIGRWAYGPCLAVAVDTTGTIACFGNGSYLEIVSLANPNQPSELSKILLPAPILDIAISGMYAYVANAGAGLRIIDISRPNIPVEQSYLETLGIASGLAVDGNKIYLADGDRGLLVFDIDIPSAPKQSDSCDTDGWASKVAVSNNFAYVADKQGGLKVIDVTDPSDLRLAGSYTTTDDVMDVAISGTNAYLAAGSAGFGVVDISDPNNPSEVVFLSDYPFATGVAVSGSHAYLIDRETGLWVIDISDPNNPSEIGHFDTDGSPHDITLSGNHVLVADGHNGFRVINVDNYRDPKEIGYLETDGSSRGVAVDSSYAYLVRWEAGLRVIDISNPSRPSKISLLNLNGRAEDVVINGNHTYLTNYENGLRVIDIADPSQPGEVGFINQNVNSKRVAIEGDYAYVADTTYGLRVVDISNALQPSLISSLEFPGKRADAIAIKENYAFLAAGDDGLGIVEITTPSQPNLIGVFILGGTAISIDVDENYAYLGTLQNDFKVVDIKNPVQPGTVGVLNMYSPLYEITAKARYVYVANGKSGLRVIDVINPSNPTEVGFYLTGSTAYGLTLDKNYIYLSCEETGLFILKFLLVSLNKPPLAPILTSPANKSFVNSTTPEFTWQIPSDENGDLLHFKVELDRDGNWSQIDHVFESKKNTAGFLPPPPVAPGSGLMNYTTQLPLSEDNWLWRVSAWDGLVYGGYSAIRSFTVDTTAPVLNSLTFENPGYGENWFNPQQDTAVALVVAYDELYPEISTLSGTILTDTLSQTGLLGGSSREVRFNFSIANQQDETYPLQASIQDSAGNIGSKAAVIQLDSTPPAGYYSDAPDSINEGKKYIVHVLGASDRMGSGVAQIYLDVFIDTTSIPTTVQDSMIGLRDPGVYYYRYFAVDHLGNAGEIKTDTTIVIPVYPQAPIFPSSPVTEVNASDDFWIDIQIGTEQQPVENLFSVDFILNYSNTQYIDIVSRDSILPGNLFGDDADIASQIDDLNGKVTIDISRKSGASNVDGFGTLARIKYSSNPNTPDQTAIHFTIPSATATDSTGYPMELIPYDTTIRIIQPFADFTMTVVPDSQTIYPGESTDFTLSFQPIGEFDSKISLDISNLPSAMEAVYPSDPFAGDTSFSVTFSTDSVIVPEIYTPIITATDGGISHSETVVINVLRKPIIADFSMTAVPDSQTIHPGESTEFTLSFQPIGEFNSQISLEISNLPSAMEAVYPSDPFASDTSFSVTFSTDSDIVPGIYKPIVTATGGGITHADTVIIFVLPKSIIADFSMTAVPDSQTIHQGESTEFTLSFQPIGEFNSQISLEIPNLPSGMEASYPTDPFSIPTSFNVTFSSNSNIEPGVYHPTVTATGGGISHQETVAINVLTTTPLGFSVLPNPFTPNNDGFNDFAEFQYQEPSSESITISIFDVNGRKITEIRNSRYWYGKDDKGREIKPGAYIYVVKNGEKVIAKGVIGVAR